MVIAQPAARRQLKLSKFKIGPISKIETTGMLKLYLKCYQVIQHLIFFRSYWIFNITFFGTPGTTAVIRILLQHQLLDY